MLFGRVERATDPLWAARLRQLAHQDNLSLAKAAALCQPYGPGLQRATTRAMMDEHVGCLIQRTLHPRIAGRTIRSDQSVSPF